MIPVSQRRKSRQHLTILRATHNLQTSYQVHQFWSRRVMVQCQTRCWSWQILVLSNSQDICASECSTNHVESPGQRTPGRANKEGPKIGRTRRFWCPTNGVLMADNIKRIINIQVHCTSEKKIERIRYCCINTLQILNTHVPLYLQPLTLAQYPRPLCQQLYYLLQWQLNCTLQINWNIVNAN